MSFNKRTLSIETITTDESTYNSLSLYQDFVAAAQQAKTYGEKFVEYERVSANTINPEDNQIFEMMETGLNELYSLWNTVMSNPVPEPVKKAAVVTTEDIPTAEELSRLCQIRDKAFCDYMDSLEQNMPDEDVDVFMPDTTQLVSAESIITPYRRENLALRRQLHAVEQKIVKLQQAQRTWIDFIIETLLPSFMLKMMSYMSFQELMAEEIQEQRETHNAIIGDLETSDKLFKNAWQSHFPGIAIPSDLKSASSVTMGNTVHSFNNNDLTNAYRAYDKAHTVDNLIKFYRLACQMHYIQCNSDIQTSANLENILVQLARLHPTMQERLDEEKSKVETEMSLLYTYMANQDILLANSIEQEKESLQEDAGVDITNDSPVPISLAKPKREISAKAKFLKDLDNKYRAFLKDRTAEKFAALYQQIHDNPSFRHSSLVKATRKLMKECYPEAYQTVRQHYLQHIDEAVSEAFISKYEKWQYDHLVYTSIMKFMHEPTIEGLLGLRFVMLGTNDRAHDCDPRFSAFIADFMEICSKTPILAVSELRSERYSIGSVEEASSNGSLTPTKDSPNGRIRSFSDSSSEGTLTQQAMELHNLSQSQYDPRVFAHKPAVRCVNDVAYTAVATMES